MKYKLIDLQETEFEMDDFEHEIRIGDFGHYYVFCDNKPYLKVEVNIKDWFRAALIHNNHLLIGSSQKVFFINLSSFEITELKVEMYFGYFVVLKQMICILDGTGIIALDVNLEEKWRNCKNNIGRWDRNKGSIRNVQEWSI